MLYDRKKFRECAYVNVRACVYVWDEGGQDRKAGGGEKGAVIFLKIICSHLTLVKGISPESSKHNEWCDTQ